MFEQETAADGPAAFRFIVAPAPGENQQESALPLHHVDRGRAALDGAVIFHLVRQAVSIPVIASSGAGCPEHFAEVFEKTGAEAALAAGIFHRREVGINEVKSHLAAQGIEVRR